MTMMLINLLENVLFSGILTASGNNIKKRFSFFLV